MSIIASRSSRRSSSSSTSASFRPIDEIEVARRSQENLEDRWESPWPTVVLGCVMAVCAPAGLVLFRSPTSSDVFVIAAGAVVLGIGAWFASVAVLVRVAFLRQLHFVEVAFAGLAVLWAFFLFGFVLVVLAIHSPG